MWMKLEALLCVGAMLIALFSGSGRLDAEVDDAATTQHEAVAATEDHHDDAGEKDEETEHHAEAAKLLVPSDDEGKPEVGSWFGMVVAGTATLFAAALAVGIAARLMGVQDPNVEASDYDRQHAEH